MRRVSLFVLSLIAAVGMYFLLGILFPDINQIAVLLAAIVIGWVIRLVLGRLQSQTSSTGAQVQKKPV
jgi:NADH:ubiquinone oxidoreductase subunit 6 (subunit J)